MDLGDFIKSISETSHNGLVDLCRKHLIHGTPFIFDGREADFYEFRKRIAEHFNIYFNDVYISGSAKLGFSPFKETIFSYDSDIDVSIVSSSLFQEVMEKIRIFQMELRNNRRAVTQKEMQQYHGFLEYTAMGWIRPDKLPRAFEIEVIKNDWFDFFNSLSYARSEVGNYKVSAGVFSTYRHLEEYTLEGLRKIKNRIEVQK